MKYYKITLKNGFEFETKILEKPEETGILAQLKNKEFYSD